MYVSAWPSDGLAAHDGPDPADGRWDASRSASVRFDGSDPARCGWPRAVPCACACHEARGADSMPSSSTRRAASPAATGSTSSVDVGPGRFAHAHDPGRREGLPLRRRRWRRSTSPDARARARGSTGCRRRPSCSTARGSCGASTSTSPRTPAQRLRERRLRPRGAAARRSTDGLFEDRWRIRRDGRLVYAETVRLAGPIASAPATVRASRPARRRSATFLHVAPDAEARLDEARAALVPGASCEAGASAWNGLLVVRFCASDRPGAAPRRSLAFCLAFRQAPLPRVWLS